MKVKDLIKKLQKFDPELIVCLSDWQEEYEPPSERAAERIEIIKNSKYSSIDSEFLPFSGDIKIGTYLCIGG